MLCFGRDWDWEMDWVWVGLARFWLLGFGCSVSVARFRLLGCSVVRLFGFGCSVSVAQWLGLLSVGKWIDSVSVWNGLGCSVSVCSVSWLLGLLGFGLYPVGRWQV